MEKSILEIKLMMTIIASAMAIGTAGLLYKKNFG
jgi:hypothetical protein